MTAAVALDPSLTAIVRPGLLCWTGAHVAEREPRLDALFATAEAGLRTAPPADTAAVRTMYKRIGLDPTKTRPSNEALLRRVLKGQPLPRVNSMVDVINWCSVEFQLPYGLYDLAHIVGSVTMRVGREGEEYAGIRKDVVHVGGRLTVADDIGPFGNPTSDSARTMVTTSTTNALVVIYAPAETTTARLDEAITTTAARLADVCGGHRAPAVISA